MNITIDERIQAANSSIASLIKLFKSKLLSRSCKLGLYRTLVRQILRYGAETWTVSKINKTKLLSFERKFPRKFFGTVRIGPDKWRIRWNNDLDQSNECESIRHIIIIFPITPAAI